MSTEDEGSGRRRPRLAVFKFASCDGCQLTLLNCEDELLALAERIDVAYFEEAVTAPDQGVYDLALVDGSITTPEDAQRVRHVREVSRHLVTLGACATAGGIQALRNYADVAEFRAVVYARGDYIDSLATSTPVSAHVPVDFELRGCPIDRGQLLEVVTAFLDGRTPDVPAHSVCFECKRRGTPCVTVARGVPCMGPVTHAGCGALCPAYGRGCYGCFGPSDSTNFPAFVPLLRRDGMDVVRLLRTFNTAAPEFDAASRKEELG
ncbi:oxidoreductase [Streptomyces sp. WMMB 322]|uniref:NADH-quinone oxidoreductase subunit B family protein n=1 Tax=Streptomyces sp. WMMB 322 TaxID=1286821 RepID=UPI0006E2A6B4|nr:oxidoreductase [Streptomyces sp. WMMB 322]SCK15831.1 Coenzyme F420-reducing hydrogenase, gamma subunit [Streptomyces sp. WMMB 322]